MESKIGGKKERNYLVAERKAREELVIRYVDDENAIWNYGGFD